MSTLPMTDEQSELTTLRARLGELEQRDQLLRTLVATSTDFIAVIDPSGRYRQVLATPTKTAAHEYADQHLSSFLPQEVASRGLLAIAQALASATPVTFTYSLPDPAGARWYTATVAPHTIDAVLWVTRELTETPAPIAGQTQQADQLRLFEMLIENALDGISVADQNGVILYGNPAFKTMTGYGEGILGTNFRDLYTGESQQRVDRESSPSVRTTGRWRGELQAVRPDGTTWVTQLSAVLLTNVGPQPRFAAIFRDMTERNAELEKLSRQERVIINQQAVLREMATPLIPLTDHVVVLPLVGSVDSARAEQIMETLLEGVVAHRAQVVIVDISGVRIVDTQVADALLRAARAVKLLGAELILTGIRPEIAQTIVRLGADLQHLRTLASLQAALRYVLREK